MRNSIDKNFYSTLYTVAIPIIIQYFIQNFVNLLDTLMVGQLGSFEIAAVALSNQIYFVLSLLLFGISSGGGVFVAQYWGKKDMTGVHKTFGIMISAVFVSASLFTLAAIIIPEKLLALYTQDKLVIEVGKDYLHIVAFSYIPMAFSLVLGITLRSSGKVKLPLVSAFIALIINTILNYILIFIFKRGVKGAALGTVSASLVEFVFIYGLVFIKKYPQAASLKKYFDFTHTDIALFIKIAIPVLINETFWGMGITVQNIIYAHVNTNALTSYNITTSIQELVWVLFIGIGNSAGVILGNCIGKGEIKKARLYAGKFIKIVIILAFLTGWIMILLGNLLPYLYNVDLAILKQSKKMLIIIMIIFPFHAFNVLVIVGILRSGGDTVYAAVMDLGGLWGIGIICGCIAAFIFHLEPWMIYIAFSLEDIFKLLLGVPRLKNGHWIRNVTIKNHH